MLVESIIFPDSTGLVSVAKRYTVADNSPDGLTLVFAHCTSSHKEVWETTIARLFELCGQRQLREAWSLDWQGHGEAGVLNEQKLRSREGVTITEYADLLHRFIQSSHIVGHRLVVVGHSASTSAWTLALPADALIVAVLFLEPAMIAPPIVPNDDWVKIVDTNMKAILARPDKWATFDAASQWLAKRFRWHTWDPRIVRLYVENAFREIVTPTGECFVTTKCAIAQELEGFRPDGHVVAARALSNLCASFPVHVIFGERPEIVSLKARSAICSAGMKSISIVGKAGHLVVQEKPDEIAAKILDIISGPPQSRL
ncbi:hypothetical protein PLICRDRAFT_179266 [Plicaturopsis crispa FD-325 SS-3]|uniref:AB hydrolase-1 domain-containing protein n=1 Tax=Plicaturopsis crispa FD-325 SS-3 TaxID=944288 RepID=A0A0C9SYB9_PLICR|nr:hypothetical protein PLICRDRAFT_179266 [Plicaturopsis crispa FD-325 SS-3]